MPVNIHGKQYVTVAERVVEAHKALKQISITSEVLYQNPVVIKATVVTEKGTYTAISAANPNKMLEKMSPYEVAETSAVGRALGFAGFGAVEGIATADEMVKAQVDPTESWPQVVEQVNHQESLVTTTANGVTTTKPKTPVSLKTDVKCKTCSKKLTISELKFSDEYCYIHQAKAKK
jgi:hypothetical protein